MVEISVQEMDRLRTLEAKVKEVVTQVGDDLCWRDVYTELAKLVGVEFCPQLMCDPAKFAANCKAFDCSLRKHGQYLPVYTRHRDQARVKRLPYQLHIGDTAIDVDELRYTDIHIRMEPALRAWTQH